MAGTTAQSAYSCHLINTLASILAFILPSFEKPLCWCWLPPQVALVHWMTKMLSWGFSMLHANAVRKLRTNTARGAYMQRLMRVALKGWHKRLILAQNLHDQLQDVFRQVGFKLWIHRHLMLHSYPPLCRPAEQQYMPSHQAIWQF